MTDAEVARAVRYAFNELKLVVEPGGAIGLAALLAGKTRCRRARSLSVFCRAATWMRICLSA